MEMFIGDITPGVVNEFKGTHCPDYANKSVDELRAASRKRQTDRDRDIRGLGQRLDTAFAGMSRPSPRHRHPATRQQAPRTGSQDFRDALQTGQAGATARQALRQGVQRKNVPAGAFGEDFALMFDAAIETAVIDRQTKEFNR